MRKLTLLPCLLLCCLLLLTNGRAQSLADEKQFVDALQNTLQQQYSRYQNREAPICSLRFYLESVNDYILASSMGSLTSKQHHSYRTLTVELLVGDPLSGKVIAASSEKNILLPLDYNFPAVEHIITHEVQHVYLKAEKTFLDKQFSEKMGKPTDYDAFPLTEAPLVSEIQLDYCSGFQMEEWENTVKAYSDLWNTFGPQVSGTATLHYTCTHSIDIRNNGFQKTHNQNVTLLTLTASLTDEEGYTIPCEKYFLVEYPSDLPEKNAILQEETALFDKMQRQANAPMVVTTTTCPVLFSSQAASLVLCLDYLSGDPASLSNPILRARQDKNQLWVECTPHSSDNDLFKKLLQTIKNQNKEYGYWIQTIHYSESDGFVPQLVFRVYADGRANELVRGLSIPKNQHFWNQVMDGGDISDFNIAPNSITASAPVRCTAPSVLCFLIDIQPLQTQPKHTLLAPVSFDETPSPLAFPSLATQVMQDEIQRFFTDSMLLKNPKPYDVEYLISDANTYTVESSMGSTLSVCEQPTRHLNTRLLVGDNTLNNENLYSCPNTVSRNLPLDNNYANMVQTAHQCTEDAYRQALTDYEEKVRLTAHVPNDGKDALKDRSEAFSKSSLNEKPLEEISLSQVEYLANDLSARFLHDNPTLYSSGVTTYVYQANAYFTNAQNIQYIRPFRLLCIQLHASAITEDGDTLHDNTQLLYRGFHDLPDIEILYQEVDLMAHRLQEWAHAPKHTEYYDGPVLLSKDAVSELLPYLLIESAPSLLNVRTPINTQNYTPNFWMKMLNKQITSNMLNISANYEQEITAGVHLIGYQTLDAEGLEPNKKTVLVQRGKLLELLSNRTPTKSGKYSNGHQQLCLNNGYLVTALGAGILEITGNNTLDERALTKELLKQARAAGNKYAYRIEKMGKQQDADGHIRLVPLYVNRIKVANGEAFPVRVSQTESVDFNLLNKVSGVSRERVAFNKLLKQLNTKQMNKQDIFWGIPSSIISPSFILLKNFQLMPQE